MVKSPGLKVLGRGGADVYPDATTYTVADGILTLFVGEDAAAVYSPGSWDCVIRKGHQQPRSQPIAPGWPPPMYPNSLYARPPVEQW